MRTLLSFLTDMCQLAGLGIANDKRLKQYDNQFISGQNMRGALQPTSCPS